MKAIEGEKDTDMYENNHGMITINEVRDSEQFNMSNLLSYDNVVGEKRESFKNLQRSISSQSIENRKTFHECMNFVSERPRAYIKGK